MTDHDALLQAVLAAPEDDLPRLVFADFLEESGHPANAARAQFIRLQIEAEQVGVLRKEELLAKAAELRPMFRDEWDLASEADPALKALRNYIRGFVYRLRFVLDTFLEIGGKALSLAPIQDLILFGRPVVDTADHWQQALRVSGMERLRNLGVRPVDNSYLRRGGEFLARRWPPLRESKNFVRLKRLDLSRNALDDEDVVAFVAAFAETSFGPGLLELDLSINLVTDAGANTLAAGRGLDNLTLLDLRNNRLTADGIAMLKRRFGERVIV